MQHAGKIAKYFITFTVFFLCGLFIFRCCIHMDHSVLDSLSATDALKQAYALDPDLQILTHEQYEEISPDGDLTGYSLHIIPEIRQIQITLRHNDSLFSRNELPEGAELRYVLIDAYTGAALLEEQLPAITAESTGEVWGERHKWMYNYRRVIFDDFTWTEDTALSVILYCDEQIVTMYPLYHPDMKNYIEPYDLSRSEKAALTGVSLKEE